MLKIYTFVLYERILFSENISFRKRQFRRKILDVSINEINGQLRKRNISSVGLLSAINNICEFYSYVIRLTEIVIFVKQLYITRLLGRFRPIFCNTFNFAFFIVLCKLNFRGFFCLIWYFFKNDKGLHIFLGKLTFPHTHTHMGVVSCLIWAWSVQTFWRFLITLIFSCTWMDHVNTSKIFIKKKILIIDVNAFIFDFIFWFCSNYLCFQKL